MITNGYGAYSRTDLMAAIESGRVQTLDGFKSEHVGPASIDLSISGGDLYEVDALIKPQSFANESVLDVLRLSNAKRVEEGHIMEPGRTYVCKSAVDLNLPPGMYAYMNAKSTSGRVFLHSFTMADGYGQFDGVDKRQGGYTGEVWQVLRPLCFRIKLSRQACYSQMRIFNRDTRFKEDDLRKALESYDIMYKRSGEPYAQKDLSLFSNDGSVLATLYAKAGEPIGYKAKWKVEDCLDLDASKGTLDPSVFFDPVYASRLSNGDGYLKVSAGDYYLLSTIEQLYVPEHLSAELRALDPRFGLFFSHFAGYIDPGFLGTVTLELMSPYDMVLRHKDVVARFEYERMASIAPSYGRGGNYQGQIGTTLPKQFGKYQL